MQKTENYNLNQWEPTDKLSRADFNADNAAIDAALANKAEKSAVTAVGNKADASALTALSAALGSGGYNLRVVHGSYTGTGTYGASNPVTLSTSFYPVAVICGAQGNVSNGHWPTILLRGITKSVCDYNSATMTVTWADKSVSWYSSEGAYAQNNSGNNTVYYYLLLGYSK